MKKFWKMLAIALVIVPCALFFAACGPTDPNQGEELTQEQLKTTGYITLKNVYSNFYNGKEDKALKTEYITRQSLFREDPENPSSPIYVQDETGESKLLVKSTYNPEAEEMIARYYRFDNNQDTEGTEFESVFVKKAENKYIRCSSRVYGSSIPGEKNYVLNYVDEEQALRIFSGKYDYSVGLDSRIRLSFEDLFESASLKGFEDNFGEMALEMAQSTEGNINLESHVTKVNGLYTFSFIVNVSNLNIPYKDQILKADEAFIFIASFTETEMKAINVSVRISSKIETDLDNNPLTPAVAFHLEQGMDYAQVFGYAFDKTLTPTNEELQDAWNSLGGEPVQNAEVRITLNYVNLGEAEFYVYGEYGEVIDLELVNNSFQHASVEKLYIDKECTQEYDFSSKLPSSDITLYGNLLVDDGYAVVCENVFYNYNYYTVEEEIEYRTGATFSLKNTAELIESFSLESLLECVEIRVNGEVLNSQTRTINLSNKGVYNIEYILKII